MQIIEQPSLFICHIDPHTYFVCVFKSSLYEYNKIHCSNWSKSVHVWISLTESFTTHQCKYSISVLFRCPVVVIYASHSTCDVSIHVWPHHSCDAFCSRGGVIQTKATANYIIVCAVCWLTKTLWRMVALWNKTVVEKTALWNDAFIQPTRALSLAKWMCHYRMKWGKQVTRVTWAYSRKHLFHPGTNRIQFRLLKNTLEVFLVRAL